MDWRDRWKLLNDQRRIMTPKDAFKNKVSGIVIGRSLTQGNIKIGK